MIVTFKNTGMIEDAAIRLNGLTVIAGENDTGKSTIGKLMFSIIKTFNRYETDARFYRVRKMEELIEDQYADFKMRYRNSPAFRDVKKIFDDMREEIFKIMNIPEKEESIKKKISEKVIEFTEIIRAIFGEDINFDHFISTVSELAVQKPAPESIFKNTFGKYISSLFNGELSNKFSEKKGYAIKGEEGGNTVFEITGSNGSFTVQLEGTVDFNDATFIESPVLLNISDLLRFAKNEFDMDIENKKKLEYLEKGYAPEYMRDFILKLTDRRGEMKPTEISEIIKTLIRGNFYYSPEERDFVFETGNKEFKGVSIASGIKCLGAIHILLLKGFIIRKSLLVIDEPETNMHPQWQVRFAELIVKLVKEGNHILLTSHSPYLIEALELYAGKRLDKDSVNFYLADKENNAFISRIYNVTNDPSPIFDRLSKPFDELEELQ
ncbi:MAG: AAA family ATPase [Candidatus Omnitrophota bacterium]